MKFSYINILWCAALAIAAASCTDEDYKVYDTAQKDSVFFEYRNANNELVCRSLCGRIVCCRFALLCNSTDT